jgi:hypothetical protein
MPGRRGRRATARGRPGAGPRARADREREGRRAGHDRGGAHRLDGACGQGARPHPLVPSVEAARAIFAGYRERLPALEERFA